MLYMLIAEPAGNRAAWYMERKASLRAVHLLEARRASGEVKGEEIQTK